MDAAFLMTISTARVEPVSQVAARDPRRPRFLAPGDSPGRRTAIGLGPRQSRQVLGFDVGSHHRWSDLSGRLSVEVWGAADGPKPWYRRVGGSAGPGGIAATAGQPWWRGPTWSSPVEWARETWDHGADLSPSDLRRRLGGVHVSLRVDDRGDGWVTADPIGQRCLYVGERRGHLYVGSRAALVAAAMDPGTSPARDVEGTAWLAFLGFRSGGRTGFEGVRSLPANTALSLRNASPSWDVEEAVAVPADASSRRLSMAEHAEVVLDELGLVLRAILSRPAPGHVVQLTGGKDSRVILAAALRADLAQELTFETIGPPSLDDVVLATTLAERYGFRHQVRFLGMKSREPYDTRAKEFVERTAAGLNLWDIDSRIGQGEIRVTGVCGAALRASRRLPVEADHDEVLRRILSPARFDRLGVIEPELAERMHADLVVEVLAPDGPLTSAHDRLQAWYLATEAKFSRFAARLEIHGDTKIPVLSSWPIVRASSAIDPLDRQDEVLVAEALRQVSGDLVDIPFTDAGWPARARAHLGGTPPPRPSSSPSPSGAIAGRGRAERGESMAAPQAAKGSKSTSLVEKLGSQIDERTSLLSEVFAVEDNPAWDLHDRATTLESLDRYGELRNIERKALFGVATAAIWLAD